MVKRRPSGLPRPARDNRSRQLDPNNDEWWKSRRQMKPTSSETQRPSRKVGS